MKGLNALTGAYARRANWLFIIPECPESGLCDGHGLFPQAAWKNRVLFGTFNVS